MFLAFSVLGETSWAGAVFHGRIRRSPGIAIQAHGLPGEGLTCMNRTGGVIAGGLRMERAQEARRQEKVRPGRTLRGCGAWI